MKYEVEGPGGKIFEIEGEDFPTESELNQIFSSFESKPERDNQVGLPNLRNTENKISQREDLLGGLLGEVRQSPAAFLAKPGLSQSMQATGAIGQRVESAFANSLLAAQRGDFKGVVDDFLKGAKGERLGETGDVIRATGVGGPLNELLAAGTGVLVNFQGINTLAKGKPVQVANKLSRKIVNSLRQKMEKTPTLNFRAALNQDKFAQEVRNKFQQVKKQASSKFETDLNALEKANPNKRIDIKQAIENLVEDMDLDPRLKTAVRRNETLKGLVEDPSKASSVTVRQAQDIKNVLQNRLSKVKKEGLLTSDDIPFVDLLDDIKQSSLDAFPELSGIRKEYGEIMGRYNLVRNQLRVGRLINAMKRNFGDAEMQKAVEELVGSKTMQEIGGFKNALGLMDLASKSAAVAAGGAILGGTFYGQRKD